jgi:phage virion morphogenesis protein
MSAAGFRLELRGKDEALAELGRAVNALDHPRDMFDEIGMALVVSTQRRFEDEKEPGGNPWPKSIRALATGGKTLTDTARLSGSMTHEASDSGVAVGTNVIYAAIHQFGGVIKPVNAPKLAFRVLGELKFVDQVTIPARPFLGIDDDDETEILAIAGDWLAQATGGENDGARP